MVLLLASMGLIAGAQPVRADSPDFNATQLQDAITAYWQQRNAREGRSGADAEMKWRISNALGCVPVFDERRKAPSREQWICVGETTAGDFHADALVQADGSSWRVVDLGGASPACAPIEQAESQLRVITGIKSLQVTGEIDDGQGMFTENRPSSADDRHVYRIMCRYESNLSTYFAYVWYAQGKYVFDPGDISGTGVPTPWHIRKLDAATDANEKQ